MSQSKTPKRASRKNRPPVSSDHKLDHNLDRKLFAYTVAAGAAGISVLALAQPSEAEIVYTKTHQYIDRTRYSIDLNNDGIVDFIISNNSGSCSTGPECMAQSLRVYPTGTNKVWAYYGGYHEPSAFALAFGQIIGPGDQFVERSANMDFCKGTRTSYYASGPWVHVTYESLGFSFTINGETHYGWARFTSHVKGRKCKSTVILTGYAYETIPGKSIEAGRMIGKNVDDADEPEAARPEASLGALALGSAEPVAWRREEETNGK